MQRRKFLIGAGSFAAATAGAIGTGAFDGVRANRDISVEVSGDGNANLALNPTSEYASFDGDGALTLDFTSDSNEDGGLNPDANTNFNDLFEITNNGPETVQVWFNTGKPDTPREGPTFHSNLANLLNVDESGLGAGGGRGANYGFYRSDIESGINFDQTKWAPSNTDEVVDNRDVTIEPGDTLSVGFWITVPEGADYNAHISGEIEVVAFTDDQAEAAE